ncbi:acetolactate synthase 2 small subunit [Ferrimonas lipolytica]|uniref:Acetolactate synthase 2 small subunit n=1 Tax=Ferrimonas lipolytica TaxID=2724191 RepID=A0A6H1UG82_9GAMM|nr:acetolactate synthase 2 small subunit [Ferrimonas lipolytica]QIZ78054.1 acetolactate synthase 2 small subunit [Ferrimonas lipolytica]
MTQHTLYIEMNPSAEVMERVLRVTRHRGFTVANMQMELGNAISSMEVTVNSERPIDQLTRQLDKLIDVNTCRLATMADTQHTKAAAHG